MRARKLSESSSGTDVVQSFYYEEGLCVRNFFNECSGPSNSFGKIKVLGRVARRVWILVCVVQWWVVVC